MKFENACESYADVHLTDAEFSVMKAALGLAVSRQTTQKIGLLIGAELDDLVELLDDLRVIGRGANGPVEVQPAPTSLRGDCLAVTLIEKREAGLILRMTDQVISAVLNGLVISRGWMVPGDCESILACSDDELLQVLKDFRRVIASAHKARKSR